MLEPGSSGSTGGGGGSEGNKLNDEDVKKVAETKILSYYKALTTGCGESSCDNVNCVSSGKVSKLFKVSYL